MKTTVDYRLFVNGMAHSKYSYKGLEALFGYLTDMEADSGTEMEFDPVAIRCDYDEYPNEEEYREEYGGEDHDPRGEYIVARFDGGIIVQVH